MSYFYADFIPFVVVATVIAMVVVVTFIVGVFCGYYVFLGNVVISMFCS